MNEQPVTAGIHKANGKAFVYPEAPWDPCGVPSSALFREIEAEMGSHIGDGTPAGTPGEPAQDLSASSIPVLYPYFAQPGFEVELDEIGDAGADQGQPESETAEASPESQRERQQLLAVECAKAEELGRRMGREQGLAEGRQQARDETIGQFQASVEAEKNRFLQQTAALFQSFRDARDGYVHRLEQEAARLALAVAARILRREAEADPLLLTGAVRVALGQLADSTAVRLRVPAADLSFWEEAMAHLPNLAIRPEVAGDPGLKLGECRLETELGSANLGLEAQIETLERGFFSPELGEADGPAARESALGGVSDGR